ncbi:glycoside hydrolase family 2 protein [Paenibacillus eucommiae]|uniref:Beta-glucuronidase n=1 Tax=Paenibacillus eucommiae TaxID=1355755 RepID=A0ABS4J0I2_9BACL|nr:glycoside hydrolase family 2 TIM barrel-domain containing protein [Paenibacillus eucommiae]MBP1992264.1 beta-glucuronidase [Paenibacillus eucommiae]
MNNLRNSVVVESAVFHLDPEKQGMEQQWFSPEYPKQDWVGVELPGAWDFYSPSLWKYEGIAWFMMTVSGDQVSEGTSQRLRFEKVSGHSKVWINGVFVGEHIGGYLPFEFEVHSLLRPGCMNQIVIYVDNEPKSNWLPGNSVIEWIQYGGILRPVSLITSHLSYISNLAISTSIHENGGRVRLDIMLTNASSLPFSGEINVQIPTAEAIYSAQSQVTCQGDGSETSHVLIDMPHAQYWSPDHPKLYEVHVELRDPDGTRLDSTQDRFGIRTVEVNQQMILLNGQPLQVKGVNRYDEFYGYGPAAPDEVIREDLLKAKSTGINLIRTHYPLDSLQLRMMDELGILVMEEIPLNWWLNPWHPKGQNKEEYKDEIIDHAEAALVDMIEKHWNHPCVIIWSMCNESGTDTPYGIEAMRRLMSKARQLDPTRLVTFVAEGNKPGHLAFHEADLVCINLYYGSIYEPHASELNQLEQLAQLPTAAHLQQTVLEFPDKPVLVTEFGCLGTSEIKGEMRHSETFQAHYIKAVWAAISSVKGVQGGMLWCWADYYHRGEFWDEPCGLYGVLTVDRKEKEAYHMLKSLYLHP